MSPLEQLAAQSPYWQLLGVFVAGISASLTPCVYPLIPVTLAVFGATSVASRLRAFLLSLSYVGGMAVTYTVLGLISAKTGYLFGSALGNPWLVSILALFLVLLSLFTLDLAGSGIICKAQSWASRIGGRGFGGAFLMGSVAGLVAAPCVGPVLIAVLTLAALSQNLLWGAMLLLVYAFGLGLLFLILGTFSGLIGRLPRSGNWLGAVKFLIATALLMVALLFCDTITAGRLTVIEPPWLALIMAGGIFLLVIRNFGNLKKAKFVAACLVAVSLYSFFLSAGADSTLQTPRAKLTWLTDLDTALALGSKENKVIMADLFADWCAACKELDAYTFSDPQVIAKLGKLVPVRIDFTSENSVTEKVKQKYGVLGLPCVLFLRGDGTELRGTRLTGFLAADAFLEHLGRLY